jgi:prevent-host-death family protein
MTNTVSKSTFKAKALELFRQVERTGTPIVITDRGVPVLTLSPFRASPKCRDHRPARERGEVQRRHGAGWRRRVGSGAVILLDTHALIWWVSEPSRIPELARRRIDAAVESGVPIGVSAISVWEVAMLVARDRLTFTMSAEQWISQVEALPFLTFLPVDNRIALRSVHLPDFPNRDPADRIIVATALGMHATLVTADQRLRAYAALKTVWD